MRIRATLTAPHEGAERRVRNRHLLRLDVAISVGEQGTDASVHDLSTTGLRIETDEKLDVGELLVIELIERNVVEAEVIWSSDRSYGCRFTAPVSQGVIGAIVLQAPIDLPASVPSTSIHEVELDSGLDIFRLANWYEEFEKRRSASGEQLIGFRKVDEHIVALVSKLN